MSDVEGQRPIPKTNSDKAALTTGAPTSILVNRRSSQNRQEYPQSNSEVQFRDILALFDKTVTEAILLGARSRDPSDNATAQLLDDGLFELRIWAENIKAVALTAESSHKSLRILDILEGPAVSTANDVLHGLEQDLKLMSGGSLKTELYKQVTIQRTSLFY